jgi:hypothetical protein
VIVDDFDVVHISGPPAKANTPLRIDPNAVLASSITLELLQAIAWRLSQIGETRSSIEHAELSESSLLNAAAQFAHRVSVEETFGVAVSKALDHRRP